MLEKVWEPKGGEHNLHFLVLHVITAYLDSVLQFDSTYTFDGIQKQVKLLDVHTDHYVNFLSLHYVVLF